MIWALLLISNLRASTIVFLLLNLHNWGRKTILCLYSCLETAKHSLKSTKLSITSFKMIKRLFSEPSNPAQRQPIHHQIRPCRVISPRQTSSYSIKLCWMLQLLSLISNGRQSHWRKKDLLWQLEALRSLTTQEIQTKSEMIGETVTNTELHKVSSTLKTLSRILSLEAIPG